MRNYSEHRYEGKNYDSNLSIKDIAKIVRSKLKEKFPKCKFSVNIKRFSMGQSLSVCLMAAPFDAFKNGSNYGYKQVNYYQLNDPWEKVETCLTKKAWNCMRKVYQIAESFNYDDSESQIDYFDTNFYLHLEVGKWDKSFRVLYSN